MAIPQWLGISLAVLVILFGGFRMYLAVAGPSNEERAKARRGMLAMSRRSHALVAILYLIVGGALLAGAGFGWSPWGAPAKPAKVAPTGGGSALPVR